MTYVLGLTGSIGMGKSTTAAMFADEGIPVWDADAAVHRLYAPGGAAVASLAAIFPQALQQSGISRDVLKAEIATNPEALQRIEAVVHPLVAEDRAAFLAATDADIVLLDIPLLFETGAQHWLDATLVVTTTPEEQEDRVLARPGMSRAQFDTILARQMPDAEKRRLADHIIETRTLDQTRADVRGLIGQIRAGLADA